MKTTLLISALLLSTLGWGQERFYEFVGGWTNTSSIELDDRYLLFGIEQIGDPTEHQFLFNELFLDGSMSDEQYFGIASFNSTYTRNGSSLYLQIDDIVYIVATVTDDSGQEELVKGALIAFDIQSRTFELVRLFEDDIFQDSFTVSEFENGLLIGSFLSDNQGGRRMFVYYTDFQGQENWSFHFSCGPNCRPFAEQILPLSDGTIAVLVREFVDDIAADIVTERAVILRLSAAGEELWRVYPGDDEGHRINPGGMVEIDGEILISYTDPYYYDADGEDFYSDSNTVHLDRYDLDGDLVSERSLLYDIPNALDVFGRYRYDISQMQTLDDGNLLLTGTTSVGALLIKLTPEGDVIWFREHVQYEPTATGPIQRAWIYHALPTSDGGFMCTGQFQANPSEYFPEFIQTAIALKTDEYGCLVPGCHLADGLLDFGPSAALRDLRVHPNPTSGELRVALPRELETETDLQLAIYDVTGKVQLSISVSELPLWQSELQLDVSRLTRGAYTVMLRSTKSGVYTATLMIE